MNYDNLNQVHDYWISNIFPYLTHHLPISSFDDYLKRVSFLPSCKWLRDLDEVKILRVPFLVDPSLFAEKYKKQCVAYACPSKPEDGIHRVVYQISLTLHVETAIYIWMESKMVQSYMAMFVCFKDEKELKKFFEDITYMRRTGDTEENPNKGFAGMIDLIGNRGLTTDKESV